MNEQDEDVILPIRGDDEEMINAINEARGSLPKFIDAFLSPKPNQASFLLKVAFEEAEEVEHIWLADLVLHSEPPTGVVANEPKLKGLKFKERVPFPLSQITDWMYMEDDALVGEASRRNCSRAFSPSNRKYETRQPYT